MCIFHDTLQWPISASEKLRAVRRALDSFGKTLAISSHDFPSNFANFPFDSFAAHAQVNLPQVYCGGSPSVAHRLDRAIDANHHLTIPFVPVRAGWVGDGGGVHRGLHALNELLLSWGWSASTASRVTRSGIGSVCLQRSDWLYTKIQFDSLGVIPPSWQVIDSPSPTLS
jgi:hypothetical protein